MPGPPGGPSSRSSWVSWDSWRSWDTRPRRWLRSPPCPSFWVCYFLPVYFQAVLDASPTRSGVMLFPIATTTAPFGVLAGILITVTGHYRAFHFLGFGLMTVACCLFTLLDQHSSTGEWVGFQLLFGVGAGIVFTSCLPAILAALPSRRWRQPPRREHFCAASAPSGARQSRRPSSTRASTPLPAGCPMRPCAPCSWTAVRTSALRSSALGRLGHPCAGSSWGSISTA